MLAEGVGRWNPRRHGGLETCRESRAGAGGRRAWATRARVRSASITVSVGERMRAQRGENERTELGNVGQREEFNADAQSCRPDVYDQLGARRTSFQSRVPLHSSR